MTRDQAINVFAHTQVHMMGSRKADDWIDAFTELGILKLDSPEAEATTYKVLNGKMLSFSVPSADRQETYVLGPNDVKAIITALRGAGLKIVHDISR